MLKFGHWALFYLAFLSTLFGEDNKPKPIIPIDIPVVMVEVVDDFVPHGEEPYVEHEMSPSPIKSTHLWLEKILRPTAKEGSAVVRIQEVSVRWQKRPGKLQKQGYWPYRSIIRLKIEIFDRHGKLVGSLNPEATRVREVNESFFGGNKHEMWQFMYRESLQSIEFELRNHLPKILKTSGKPVGSTVTKQKPSTQQPKASIPDKKPAAQKAKVDAQTSLPASQTTQMKASTTKPDKAKSAKDARPLHKNKKKRGHKRKDDSSPELKKGDKKKSKKKHKKKKLAEATGALSHAAIEKSQNRPQKTQKRKTKKNPS